MTDEVNPIELGQENLIVVPIGCGVYKHPCGIEINVGDYDSTDKTDPGCRVTIKFPDGWRMDTANVKDLSFYWVQNGEKYDGYDIGNYYTEGSCDD